MKKTLLFSFLFVLGSLGAYFVSAVSTDSLSSKTPYSGNGAPTQSNKLSAAEFNVITQALSGIDNDLSGEIKFARDISPETDNTYDLGGSGAEWKEVHAEDIFLDTANTNTLCDSAGNNCVDIADIRALLDCATCN